MQFPELNSRPPTQLSSLLPTNHIPFGFYEACKKLPEQSSARTEWSQFDSSGWSAESSAQFWALSTITNQLSINTSSVKANSFGRGPGQIPADSGKPGRPGLVMWAGTPTATSALSFFITSHVTSGLLKRHALCSCPRVESGRVQAQVRCHGCWQPDQRRGPETAWLRVSGRFFHLKLIC